ncbi:hypothetical protein CLSAB_19670 [Clostridium saccharobutylicum]|uniref:hypothetical protein n=1 Tax=Clostridium saccharobutylicum TaxID=169679 RepID=UPI00098CC346|nr:hypothetical protein [Clostridium saccharobutylicum]OOM17247.1 hypothetical protein CLSAB_19670 [Clostridium saccharobutylicum]
MDKYNFKKSTCERYDIKLKDTYGGWAIITIDENGGLFNAHTDYGDYNYSWPNHGRESFKHFILELVKDKSYFLGKVANDKYYYAENTEKAWKEQIIEDRREGELSEEQARELWDEITDFDYHTSCDHLQHQCYESDIVNKYYCEPWYHFDVVQGFSPQAHAFADIIMPILGEIIQKEIEEKEKTA